jgi:adenosylcobinamide-phosphate synthase
MLTAEPLLAKAFLALIAVALALAGGALLAAPLQRWTPPVLAECLAAGFAGRLNRPGRRDSALAWRGGFLTVLLALTGFGLGVMIERAAGLGGQAWLLMPLTLAACLTPLKPLQEGRRVLRLLDDGGPAVDAAQRRVLAAQTIEQTAASLTGGLVAPLFWFALLGLAGLGAFVAVSALARATRAEDSAAGPFAEAPQQAAVLLQWLPSWITAFALLAASLFVPHCSPGLAVRSLWQALRRPGWIVADPSVAILAGALKAELANHRALAARGWNFAVGAVAQPAGGVHVKRALALYGVASIQTAALVLAALHFALRAS